MDLSQEPILALARSPSAGAPVVLARGRLLSAVLLVFAATCLSALGAVRFVAVPREENAQADRLVNETLDRVLGSESPR